MTAYFKLLGERALVAFASALLSALGAGAVNILNVPWKDATAVAAGAALVAILASVAGGALTSSKSPAITAHETEIQAERNISSY